MIYLVVDSTNLTLGLSERDCINEGKKIAKVSDHQLLLMSVRAGDWLPPTNVRTSNCINHDKEMKEGTNRFLIRFADRQHHVDEFIVIANPPSFPPRMIYHGWRPDKPIFISAQMVKHWSNTIGMSSKLVTYHTIKSL